MPDIVKLDEIIDFDLWSRIKAKFGFEHQYAKSIFFRNECILTQDISAYMNDPEWKEGVMNTTAVGYLNIDFTVPAGHRYHLINVAFKGAATETFDLVLINIGGATYTVTSFVAAQVITKHYGSEIIMTEGQTLGVNVVSTGAPGILWWFVYYIDEVIG